MTDQWGDRAGKDLARKFKAHCRELGAVCWLCHQPIAYDAPAQTSDAFEPDHAVPRDVAPELALDWDNLRPAHCSCNRARGKRDVPLPLGPQTRAW
ncbi:HNH endonuclease [Corynebacterium sp.]|uniref:HNH endonuclease n=1 Tax=Corynebacterium sp. TaxID=1720 RepID=UPI0025BA369E|nr:HNH endonuclease [Corynebacterium sp.]